MAKLTLYDIETGLVEVYAAYEAALEDENTPPEELAALDAVLQEYIDKEVVKVDGIAFFMREMEKRKETKKEEAERYLVEAKRCEAAYDRVRAYVLATMLRLGKKTLKGDANTFSIKKNPASLEIDNPYLIPDAFREFTFKLNYRGYLALLGMLMEHAGEEGRLMSELLRKSHQTNTINSAIKDALKTTIECVTCSGTAVNLETGDPCACAATPAPGRIPAMVPGARLITDRVRVDLDRPRKNKDAVDAAIAIETKSPKEIPDHADPQEFS